ncbi:MAG: four helix bundle protein [Deltaproteobacteria bacterium]|nr:four helix bundle protein [Deltaproteobacteria bacterium]
MGIYNYRELDIWKKGMTICEKVYFLTASFPSHEQYGVISQLRRAAVSVPANIAEGFGRKSNGDFKRFLNIATGSLLEVETHIELSRRLHYCADVEAANLFEETNHLGKMMTRFTQKIPNTKY